jgi:hypothetical protein
MLGPKRLSRRTFWFLHILVLLSLLALWGYIETNDRYLILLSVLSFYGSLCVAFISVLRK